MRRPTSPGAGCAISSGVPRVACKHGSRAKEASPQLDPDRGKALAALRTWAVTSVRKDLKGGRLWLAHSRKHRDREAMLIPPAE